MSGDEQRKIEILAKVRTIPGGFNEADILRLGSFKPHHKLTKVDQAKIERLWRHFRFQIAELTKAVPK